LDFVSCHYLFVLAVTLQWLSILQTSCVKSVVHFLCLICGAGLCVIFTDLQTLHAYVVMSNMIALLAPLTGGLAHRELQSN